MVTACERDMRQGATFTSAVGTATVLVLEAGIATHPPTVNGHSMVPGRPTPCGMRERRVRDASGPIPGRVYIDVPTGLTLLCTRSGVGCLSYAGRPMVALSARRVAR
jgi:hypothetical protein